MSETKIIVLDDDPTGSQTVHSCLLLTRWDVATLNDYYMAAAYTVRDRLLDRWLSTAKTYKKQQSRTVCYLSAEYLLGPHLGNNLLNLGITEQAAQAAEELGLDSEEILEQEEEPGLGNGGLGRLAACYLDSLATLQIPAIGYGIRYEYGIFDQEIRDGWQVEITDKWLHLGNPWEIQRPEITFDVGQDELPPPAHALDPATGEALGDVESLLQAIP